MIHLDTSAVIGALSGPRTAAATLRAWIADGVRPGLCTLVLYEWWRGPRTDEELRDQERLLPSAEACEFGVREAEVAAALYRQVKRPRGRELDLAIAACAIARGATLWTLNPGDFRDLPGLDLARR